MCAYNAYNCITDSFSPPLSGPICNQYLLVWINCIEHTDVTETQLPGHTSNHCHSLDRVKRGAEALNEFNLILCKWKCLEIVIITFKGFLEKLFSKWRILNTFSKWLKIYAFITRIIYTRIMWINTFSKWCLMYII